LSFIAPEKVRFKCRLNNLETEWANAGAKRVATYNYIPPGNYSFQVIACNNDGVWNEVGANLAFRVLPYFWQTTWFRLLAGVATLLATSGFVWADARRRMRRRLEKLERERAMERERARIAQDIHDDLGASLTRIAMLSESVRGDTRVPEPVAKNLDRIFGTARELTRAMDEIVWAVNPRHDTLDSLANYLSRFAHDYLSAAEIRCRLDVPLQLPALPVMAEMRHNLFLAFKEALHNVVQHSGAAEVRVELKLEIAQLTLRVADDGRGFNTATPAEGHAAIGRIARGNGLTNMRRRLADIGGACEIGSKPGMGTAVVFTVRLPGA
jgi:signal transduction histidine kinase